MNNKLAIIGGSGLTELQGLEVVKQQTIETPYGSCPITYGLYNDQEIVFLARHGAKHTIAPHKINYRANIWGLKEIGIKNIIAVAAVGSINPTLQVSDLVIPHQIIDYTYSREHTFFDQDIVTHIDFTEPYCESLRQKLLAATETHSKAVHAITQGPRLETAAEIDRLEKDGADIVGMTGMPEAALARELELCYACCAVIANEAAGRGKAEITMAEIEANLINGIAKVQTLLSIFIKVND
jgi:5'-methylthioinosine phosphorylase